MSRQNNTLKVMSILGCGLRSQELELRRIHIAWG